MVLCYTDEIPSRDRKVTFCFILHSSLNPSAFDPYFGNFDYLMTSVARSRLKGYLRTFVYMTICGLLLMFGGAAFFIRESVEFANEVKTDDILATQQSNYSTTKPHNGHGQNAHVIDRHNSDASSRHESYATELRTIGLIFLGIGFILFAVGSPFAYQFWKRYQRSKETERNPILEPSAPQQLSLSHHNRTSNKPTQISDHFQNPIHFESDEPKPFITEDVELLRNTNLHYNVETSTRETTTQLELDPSQQVLFGRDASGSKPTPSLLHKLFGIDDVFYDDAITLDDVTRRK